MDTAMRCVFRFAALATFAVTLTIIIVLVFDAWDFFSKVDKSVLWGEIGWFPRRGLFDIPTLVVGTLIVTGIAMLVAVPLGLGAAIYLSEYASPRMRRVLKPVLEVLAGIPSVVLGYFAIAFINPNLIVRFFDSANKAFSVAAAGLAVGVLSIPIIASVSEDALRAVPMSLREASYGLGARRSATAFRVVFPAAISGIIAALILGISRAIGETMVVAIAAGAVGGGLFSLNPLQPGQTMTAAMAALGFGSDQVAGDDLAFKSLYFVGLLLFVMTLLLNFVGDRLVARVREEY
jgi:phosphate transport system permease protein